MNIESTIANHLDIDISKVTDDAHLINDLGADSLHVVELVIEFETQYDIEIPDEDAEQLDTVGKIKQYIKDYA
jgi:acyl carrier protein